jgi:hypothetical protein
MKKLKYVKLFESFLNEELSPETQKRTYDAMVAIAQDPSALDKKIKSGQAKNIESMLAPSVKSALKKLKSAVANIELGPGSAAELELEVQVYDNGMSEGTVTIHVGLNKYTSITGFFESIFMVVVSKDKYQRIQCYISASLNEIQRRLRLGVYDQLEKDRAFITSLKNLIVEIQKNEIPGDLEVPSEPESVTPEGSIIHVGSSKPEEDINLGHDRSAYLD